MIANKEGGEHNEDMEQYFSNGQGEKQEEMKPLEMDDLMAGGENKKEDGSEYGEEFYWKVNMVKNEDIDELLKDYE